MNSLLIEFKIICITNLTQIIQIKSSIKSVNLIFFIFLDAHQNMQSFKERKTEKVIKRKQKTKISSLKSSITLTPLAML